MKKHGITFAIAPREFHKKKGDRMKHKNESGQGLVEYIILVALVVLVCVGSSKLLGKKINSKLKEVKEQIDEGIPVNLSP